MGFHTRQIPEIDYLIALRQTLNDDKAFLHRVYGTRADAYTGSTESMNYLEEVEAGLKRSAKAEINT